jgi:hypothetical protein
VVGCHKRDRRPAEYTRIVQPAAVEHRLREAQIIARGGHRSAAAGIVFRGLRHDQEAERIARGWIFRKRFGQARNFVSGYEKSGVDHLCADIAVLCRYLPHHILTLQRGHVPLLLPSSER